MRKPSTVININPLTIIIIVLALLSANFSYLFVLYFIGFIHEASHYLMAKILKVSTRSFTFLPVGFYLSIENFEDIKPFKAILILIAGPASYFISATLIEVAFKYGFFSLYGYQDAVTANLSVALFNLIPFVPLDGGRLLDIILNSIFSVKTAKRLTLAVSFLSLVCLMIFLLNEHDYLLICFLIMTFIMELLMTPKKEKMFLKRRQLLGTSYPLKIVKRPLVYRYFESRIFKEGRLIKEGEMIQEMLDKSDERKRRKLKRLNFR